MKSPKILRIIINENLNCQKLVEDVSLFTTEKETDKALFVKIPYWLETGKSKVQHEQKELNLWIPKSQIKNNIIPDWIIEKSLNDLKQKNSFININSIKKHLGEYAPKKEKIVEFVPDDNARREYEREWIKTLPKQYQSSRGIEAYYFVDEEGSKEEFEQHMDKMNSFKIKVISYV